ncbi:MAG TPA: NTP transferase domain-containing protein [Steroidobacteraceae bacterium]|nr:NTP transferase domain-containing protein [Steroidobacteraceae bacterium]
MSAPPLHGLVLAGGRSTRMQRDKAAIVYQRETQLGAAMQLLAPRVVRAFVSVRAEQRADAVRAAWPQIVDRGDVEGPIAGISAALAESPDAAWLVLACDLPFLDAMTLDRLIAGRDPASEATAFRSSHDGLPEPLCAIYEPRAREALAAHIAGGRNCPRKFLIGARTRLLEQPNPRALDNVNTVAEYGAAMSALTANQPASAEAPAREIRVQYYALLREQAGRSAETLSTRARTPRELYAELRARHPFTLPPEMLRVAVNAEFGDWSHPLQAGDAVVFIPPVAGG